MRYSSENGNPVLVFCRAVREEGIPPQTDGFAKREGERGKTYHFMAILLALISVGIFWGAPALLAQSLFTINFENDEVGKFPTGWSSRDKENMGKVYSVQAEDGHRFLHSEAKGISVPIGLEKAWVLEEFPILRWRWRARVFPEGTNEREKRGNDSVLSVYVVLGGWPVPSSIKYIWSDTLPVGTTFDSPHSGKTKIFVVRSGRSAKGKWLVEERHVLADYRSLFGKGEKNPSAKGILLLTDSDNTMTCAAGDYDEVTVAAK